MSAPDLDLKLADEVAKFYDDPLGFVLFAYDWDNDPSLQICKLPEPYSLVYDSEFGPDKWACDLLTRIGEKVKANGFNGRDPVDAVREAVVSGHGIGKAHPLTAIVETPQGRRRWGEIQPGDELFGADGTPVRVLARRDYTDAPLVLVTFNDGSKVACSTGHLWRVRGRNQRRKGSGWVTMSAAELLEAGVKRPNGRAQARQWEVPQQGAAAFPSSPVAVDPYVLAVWLGDGGRNSGRITTNDLEVLARIKKAGYQVTEGAKQGTTALSLSLRGLRAQLRDLRVVDKYSYQKAVPLNYLYNSAEVRAEVLRGLLDADGEVNTKGSIVFNSTSEQLVRDVIWLARSLGGRASLQPTVKSPTYPGPKGDKLVGRPCWRATVTLPAGFRAFYIERKQERVRRQQARYLTRWIESIEPIPTAPSMCVEVVGGLYQIEEFVVTHNSAITAWLVDWIMSTRPFSHGTITANTAEQLASKTWAEVTKWTRRCITGHWFEVTTGKGAMRMRHRQHPEDWFCTAQTCREENSEAFAGQHAASSTSFYIFDEASAVPDAIKEVSEGGLTDGEPMMFAFGNGTRNTGWFKDCFGADAHRWGHTHVDSREVQITNKKFIAELIEDYGIDSDFVKVRVRGMFPAQSIAQFISTTDVDAAFDRHLRRDQYDFAPVILTCDPAWEGDDTLVIGKRQGLRFDILRKIAKNDNDVQVATLLAQLEDEHKADAVNVDAGYGTGIVSAGQTMGRAWNLVWFSGASPDAGCLNLRAYMWREMRDWLKEGGAIPPDHELHRDLIGPETVPRLDGKIQLESKNDMKRRKLPSPNCGDALALSFALPVAKKRAANRHQPREHDPYKQLEGALSQQAVDHDPYRNM